MRSEQLFSAKILCRNLEDVISFFENADKLRYRWARIKDLDLDFIESWVQINKNHQDKEFLFSIYKKIVDTDTFSLGYTERWIIWGFNKEEVKTYSVNEFITGAIGFKLISFKDE